MSLKYHTRKQRLEVTSVGHKVLTNFKYQSILLMTYTLNYNII